MCFTCFRLKSTLETWRMTLKVDLLLFIAACTSVFWVDPVLLLLRYMSICYVQYSCCGVFFSLSVSDFYNACMVYLVLYSFYSYRPVTFLLHYRYYLIILFDFNVFHILLQFEFFMIQSTNTFWKFIEFSKLKQKGNIGFPEIDTLI